METARKRSGAEGVRIRFRFTRSHLLDFPESLQHEGEVSVGRVEENGNQAETHVQRDPQLQCQLLRVQQRPVVCKGSH